MGFQTVTPPQIKSQQRLRQQGITPTAVKYNFMQFYNAANNTYQFNNNDGQPVFIINPNNNTITFYSGLTITSPMNFSAAIEFLNSVNITGSNKFTYNGITVQAPVKEIQMYLLSGGASGGTLQSYYTSTTAIQNLNASAFTINPDNYPGCTFLLEALYRAGATGDPAHTFTMDLFDVTGNAVVTNSSISGSGQSTTGAGGIPILRGTTNFRGNMTSGDRKYILRYHASDANFVDLYAAKLIIKY